MQKAFQIGNQITMNMTMYEGEKMALIIDNNLFIKIENKNVGHVCTSYISTVGEEHTFRLLFPHKSMRLISVIFTF